MHETILIFTFQSVVLKTFFDIVMEFLMPSFCLLSERTIKILNTLNQIFNIFNANIRLLLKLRFTNVCTIDITKLSVFPSVLNKQEAGKASVYVFYPEDHRMLYKTTVKYLHSTSTMILLETDGGTPFVAMQRYAPISVRLILARFSCSPSCTVTGKINFTYLFMWKICFCFVSVRRFFGVVEFRRSALNGVTKLTFSHSYLFKFGI